MQDLANFHNCKQTLTVKACHSGISAVSAAVAVAARKVVWVLQWLQGKWSGTLPRHAQSALKAAALQLLLRTLRCALYDMALKFGVTDIMLVHRGLTGKASCKRCCPLQIEQRC